MTSQNPIHIEKDDDFWMDEPNILWQPERIGEIIPTPDMTPLEKLNAIMRFSICLAVILTFYYQSWWPLGILVLVGLVIVWFRHSHYVKTWERQVMIQEGEPVAIGANVDDVQTPCRAPTINNPFMNPSPLDYGVEQTYSGACPMSPVVNAKSMYGFYSGLYQDVQDLYGKRHSERMYYTVPGSGVPNDQSSYALWLYGQPAVCKSGDWWACTGNDVGAGQ